MFDKIHLPVGKGVLYLLLKELLISLLPCFDDMMHVFVGAAELCNGHQEVDCNPLSVVTSEIRYQFLSA